MSQQPIGDAPTHLGQIQGLGDVRALAEGEVLLGLELPLEFHQLLRREGRAPPSGLAADAAHARAAESVAPFACGATQAGRVRTRV